jgi:hypothetical protein
VLGPAAQGAAQGVHAKNHPLYLEWWPCRPQMSAEARTMRNKLMHADISHGLASLRTESEVTRWASDQG